MITKITFKKIHFLFTLYATVITLLVKVSQGHNYQIATNKTCTVHEVLFLQIVHVSGQTTANKLSTGHRVLFLKIAHASGQITANKLSTGHRVLFLQIADVSGETGANKLSMGYGSSVVGIRLS